MYFEGGYRASKGDYDPVRDRGLGEERIEMLYAYRADTRNYNIFQQASSEFSACFQIKKLFKSPAKGYNSDMK